MAHGGFGATGDENGLLKVASAGRNASVVFAIKDRALSGARGFGQLNPGKLAAVVNLLEAMVHNDDEPVTEEDRSFHEGQA